MDEHFRQVLKDHTAGDPMREAVKWTNLSRRQIARRMQALGTSAGKNVVSRLLREHGYRRRKPQKKRTMGQHADRNAQFEKIAQLKQTYLQAGKPVISIDTKKKELLGNFYREGVTDAVEPTEVNDHDFPSYGNGQVIPHGIYDLARNEAALHLNTSHDTTEFACESLGLWWREQGKPNYPEADELLVLCDGGGSNSSSAYLFKQDLQALADSLNLTIRIAHYPPYCSKYNPIEHRLFPHVTRACRGVPLETVETAKHYMAKTETTTGLKVAVRIISKVFETGRKYTQAFKDNMTIQFDDFLPKWNYTATPQSP
ncbi:MAG: ISAzo13 family transposase [Candidatus Thiothrix putei]|uniref:ISAzo13 family transposase n=2 Tax=Candidatus Thiothrix putei TaxID=3080811 RepID=A0AA95HD71_9GAMM|nr:MAG: ISAzo13 family transposase [Candidatus Thiothrix putei]WGZ93128.1 MAG: ISAzo13 family transposase [Candidatus Thiothrix putei]WGZ93400.1 MAG: ISAzo13 family transposase [Candidatus Thiothrix putei]WGZ94122.1 MAG: ISAzo13 family transposase [Candidatus Thiothrix putei]WGZ94287.1 MAG: ISAzo13 family transposase [Candidatus Thiothrix putei]